MTFTPSAAPAEHQALAPRPYRRPIIISLAVTLGLMFGGVYLLLGLPGALYASLTVPLVEALRGLPPGYLIQGDRAWPLAILLTFLVPLPLPLLLGLGLRWTGGRRWRTLLVSLVGLWIWAVVATYVVTSGVDVP